MKILIIVYCVSLSMTGLFFIVLVFQILKDNLFFGDKDLSEEEKAKLDYCKHYKGE